MNDKVMVSWYEIETIAAKIGRMIVEHGFDVVMPIARGGLVAAGLVAQHLPRDTRWCVANTSSYGADPAQGTQPFTMHIPNGYNKFYCPRKLVILDSIVDSGNTIRAMREHLGDVPVASLCVRSVSEPSTCIFILRQCCNIPNFCRVVLPFIDNLCFCHTRSCTQYICTSCGLQ